MCISMKNTTVIRRSVTYVNEFLRGVVVIAMLLGIVFAWVLSKAIVGRWNGSGASPEK